MNKNMITPAGNSEYGRHTSAYSFLTSQKYITRGLNGSGVKTDAKRAS